MTASNNSNSYGQDDLRDDEFNYEDSSANNTYPGEKKEKRPDEMPEKRKSAHEKSGYPRETEYRKPAKSSDASYSEQTDVTPPNPHEFPSVGNAKTDFVSRPHPRKTGRMVGHEPGTEGI